MTASASVVVRDSRFTAYPGPPEDISRLAHERQTPTLDRGEVQPRVDGWSSIGSLGKGDSISPYVARCLEVVAASGVNNRLHAAAG
jgi:hypothetical protein